jgi:phosphoribosylamine--glycine ligase
VLTVVGQGDDLDAARGAAYAGIERISLADAQWRTDIARAAAEGRITVP